MLNSKRILIIGKNERNLQRAKAIGLEVLYIEKKELFSPSALTYADQSFFIDYENPKILLPLVKAIYDIYPFKYVISLTETGLVPAAQVNDALSLSGNSLETVNLLKDKWAMRQHLNSTGISPVFAQIGTEEADLISFAKSNGLPMIVKPVSGTGSFGVLLIKDDSTINQVWQKILELNLSPFIMEEYLEGEEISVEAFSFNGHHVVISITNKVTLPNFVEIGHSVPAQMEPSARSEVVETVTSFLTAVGLREGPSHTELKITPNGVRILESHNRVGGDKINKLVEIAYGIDMISLAFAWPYGKTEALSNSPNACAAAAIHFFTPSPGIVKEISGLEKIQSQERVVEIELSIELGSRVFAVNQSKDRSGYVIAKGENAQEAVSTCKKLAEEICIYTE